MLTNLFETSPVSKETGKKPRNVSRNKETVVQRLISSFIDFISNRQQFRISLDDILSFWTLESAIWQSKCKVNTNFYIELLFAA